MRRAVVLLLGVLVAATLATSTPAVAGGPRGADLPPAQRDRLARLFDPRLRELGFRTTRAALQDEETYRTTSTGTHLAIYVEPIDRGPVDDAVYVESITEVARVFLPRVFKEWSDLKTFDVCLEPERGSDPRPVPPPVTQLFVTREGAADVRWKRADLADLLARAAAADDGGSRFERPFSLYVSPRLDDVPAYAEAAEEAGVATPTTGASGPDRTYDTG